MRIQLPDPPPPGFAAALELRRRSGMDRLDEVWDGVIHLVPAPSHAHARIAQQLAELLGPLARAADLEPTMHEFNVGTGVDNFRIPDGGLHRPGAGGVWHPTAALVVEIRSPGDEAWEKLPFYAERDVDEVLIIDPRRRTVDWLALDSGEYRPLTGKSLLIDLSPAQLDELLDWPADPDV